MVTAPLTTDTVTTELDPPAPLQVKEKFVVAVSAPVL